MSRSTCCKWEKELSAAIAQLKQENLEELYTAYGMAKEGRIRRLGDTLRRIDDALDEVDLTAVPPDKLLSLKLRYLDALNHEYSATVSTETTGEAGDTLSAIQDLYRRTASGETPIGRSKAELNVLGQLVEQYQRAHPMDIFTL